MMPLTGETTPSAARTMQHDRTGYPGGGTSQGRLPPSSYRRSQPSTGGTSIFNEQAGNEILVFDYLGGDQPLTQQDLGATGFLNQSFIMGGSIVYTATFDLANQQGFDDVVEMTGGMTLREDNAGRIKQIPIPRDPYYQSTGSWQQNLDDQWAIKRTGLDTSAGTAWTLAGEILEPVVVAVVDSGLAWNHEDIDHENIWINEDEIVGNGIDDDGNRYIDDVIGWNFVDKHNVPWDFDGHGTFVAGVIAATHNDVGIAGVNPAAKIMVLKAMDAVGNTHASFVAEAIVYAADNGAQIINVSIGGESLTEIERMAIEYADDQGFPRRRRSG